MMRADWDRLHPRLRKLLEADELDWDDQAHREAYLKAWLNLPRTQGDDDEEEGSGGQ